MRGFPSLPTTTLAKKGPTHLTHPSGTVNSRSLSGHRHLQIRGSGVVVVFDCNKKRKEQETG